MYWWFEYNVVTDWSQEERLVWIIIYLIAAPTWVLLFLLGDEVAKLVWDEPIAGLVALMPCLPSGPILGYWVCRLLWPDLVKQADEIGAARRAKRRQRVNQS